MFSPVQVHVVDGHVCVVLLHDSLGASPELGGVLGGPPLAQAALGVELAALVVEAVRDLVPDHRSDGAVVHGVVGIGVEERWLQDARGEDDFVE